MNLSSNNLENYAPLVITRLVENLFCFCVHVCFTFNVQNIKLFQTSVIYQQFHTHLITSILQDIQNFVSVVCIK
jgi:hypothetical protein